MNVVLGSFFIFQGLVFFVLSLFVWGSGFVLDFLLKWFFFDFSMGFYFDFFSCCFFSFVSLISGVVFFYSSFYMEGVKRMELFRFLLVVFFFVVSMFFLVFSYSWFLLILGWDMLGVISFILVIYYKDSKSLDSGMFTFLVNRLGDCCFLGFLVFMFKSGWFSFDVFFEMSVVGLFFVVVGCMTKSAQFPFSAWLPAAMAAPTPVSSLVHSSTLVTAGVYVMIRFNSFLEGCTFFLMVVSLLTMFFGGLFALVEMDIKKIVAMSTLSQLGFMVFCVSLGFWDLSYYHMLFHAVFKSFLFLCTGGLMHLVMGGQDCRFYGGFYLSFFTKLFFSVSCLSLMGFPFCMGFYSKDCILSSLGECFLGSLMFLLFFLSCCFTVMYSFRLLGMGFLEEFSLWSSSSLLEEGSYFLPLVLLFFLDVFLGEFLFNLFFPLVVEFSFFELFMGVVLIFLGWCFWDVNISGVFFSIFSFMNCFMFLSSKFSLGGNFYFLSFIKVGEVSWMEKIVFLPNYLFLVLVELLLTRFFNLSLLLLFGIVMFWILMTF